MAGAQELKGDRGTWPSEAFDMLSGRIDFLQAQLDDVREKLAEIQEIIPLRRGRRANVS
jgi:hypothetical protein